MSRFGDKSVEKRGVEGGTATAFTCTTNAAEHVCLLLSLAAAHTPEGMLV